MKIPEYAKISPLPLKTLNWMARERIVHDPLRESDIIGLKMLEQVWRKREILRIQLAGFSKKRRLKLIETADVATKWERYAFSRFQNITPGKRLLMERVIDEIELTFGFVLKPSHIKKLYLIRKKVYNLRHSQKRYKNSLPGQKKFLKTGKQ